MIETYKKLQDKIKFHGVQFDQGKPIGYLFSDRITGSNFLITINEPDKEATIMDRLEKLIECFCSKAL